MNMNVAKGFIKHSITKEMIKPCEMYQIEAEENVEKSGVQQIEESEEK